MKASLIPLSKMKLTQFINTRSFKDINYYEARSTRMSYCENVSNVEATLHPFSAPDWFDDEWISKIRQDTGDNRRLKVYC